MKFAEKCDRESALLEYAPGAKNDIMSDLEDESAGIGALAMKRVRGDARIPELLARIDRIQAELTEYVNAPELVDDGSVEYIGQLGERIRTGDRLIGDFDDDDEFIEGEVTASAREIVREYGKFLLLLDKEARRAFQRFELMLTKELIDGDGDGGVIDEWIDNHPDIEWPRFEIGTRLAMYCVRIGHLFAVERVAAAG